MKVIKPVKRQVHFNPEYEKDLINHTKGKKFSTYVKQLIREDMKK